MTLLTKQDTHISLSIKKGKEMHGQKIIYTLLTEYSKLDEKDIFDPQRVENLSCLAKIKASHLITMLKEKRCGKFKTKARTNGRKQLRYISKEEVTPPTIQLETIIMSLLIDVREECALVTVDDVGEYFLVIIEDYVLLKLTEDTVVLMCQINPKYLPFVTQKGGKLGLHMYLKKVVIAAYNQI